jgi:hypothetical protein
MDGSVHTPVIAITPRRYVVQGVVGAIAFVYHSGHKTYYFAIYDLQTWSIAWQHELVRALHPLHNVRMEESSRKGAVG